MQTSQKHEISLQSSSGQLVSRRDALIHGLLGTACVIAGESNSPARERAARRPTFLGPDSFRPRRNETHGQFQAESEHFVVISSKSRSDAKVIAQTAETAWKDISTFADGFTTLHRHREFGQRAIGIRADASGRLNQARSVARPNSPPGEQGLFITYSPGQDNTAQFQQELRKSVTINFMQLAGFDLRLPQWTLQGIATYVGREPFRSEAQRTQIFEPSDPNSQTEADTPYERVRYLLEGADALHAPAFLTSLRKSLRENGRLGDDYQTVAREPSRRSQRTTEYVRNYFETRAVDRFWQTRPLQTDWRLWRRDTQMGQPILEITPGEDRSLTAFKQQLVAQTKLLERFGVAPATMGLPRTIQWKEGKTEQRVWGTMKPRATDLRDFHAKLNHAAYAWATIDGSGRVVWSHERKRLESLFATQGSTYRIEWGQNRPTLVAQTREYGTWRSEISSNPDNSYRKKAIVEKVNEESSANS